MAKHNNAKEEATKARLALQTVKSSAVYESKRRESELATAIARWNKVPASNLGGGAITLNSSEAIGRFDMGASSGRRVPSEVAILEDSLKDMNNARDTAQGENVQLREVINDINSEIRATLETINAAVAPVRAGQLDAATVDLPSSHMSLSPNELTEHLTRLLITLRDAAVGAVDDARTDKEAADETKRETETHRIQELEESLAVMQAELDQAQALVEQLQTDVMSYKLEEETRNEQLAADGKQERAEMRRQKKELEAERRKFFGGGEEIE